MSKTSTQTAAAAVPDLLAILQPFFERAAPHELRLLVAQLERYAAEHYRRWAADEPDAARRQGFLDCALREEFIAETLEDLEPHASRMAQSLRERFPDLRRVYADAMLAVSKTVQWQAQATGEMGAGNLQRNFAEAEPDPAARARLLGCVDKEEESARFLRSLL